MSKKRGDTRTVEEQLEDDEIADEEDEEQEIDGGGVQEHDTSTATKTPVPAPATRTFPSKKRTKINSGHYVQEIGPTTLHIVTTAMPIENTSTQARLDQSRAYTRALLDRHKRVTGKEMLATAHKQKISNQLRG